MSVSINFSTLLHSEKLEAISLEFDGILECGCDESI